MSAFGPSKVALKVNGYKTYIIVAVALVLGAVDGLGIVHIPNWVYEILPFLGLGTLRHAIMKAQDAAVDAAKAADGVKIGE